MSTLRKPSSWYAVLALMSPRHLASFLVLSVAVQLNSIGCSRHYRSTRDRPKLRLSQVQSLACRRQTHVSSSGGCDSAMAVRCWVVCGTFEELLPILTTRYLLHQVRGKNNMACIFLAMVHASERWGPTISDMLLKCSTSTAMISSWSVWSVVPTTKTKHTELQCYIHRYRRCVKVYWLLMIFTWWCGKLLIWRCAMYYWIYIYLYICIYI